MGIPIGGDKRSRRRRRSYADYKATTRRTPPRSDPFRVVFYLILIAGAFWVYRNADDLRRQYIESIELPSVADQPFASVPGEPTGTPDVTLAASSPEQLATEAEDAYQNGQLTRAIELYQQANSLSPNTVEYPTEVARLLIFEAAIQYGDEREATLEAANDAASDAILANPNHPAGYAILGKVQDWQGNPSEGLNNVQRAIELDNTYALAHSYLAEIQIDLERWAQAQTTIEQALELEPNHVDVRRDYGYVLESQGDYAAAATQYEAAVTAHPNLAYLRVALARIYRVLGRHDEALDQLFAVETMSPNNALVMLEVGRTYETYIGDLNQALDYFERAVEVDDSLASAWLRIGVLRYTQGSWSQAAIAFEHVLEQKVESAEIYAQLGLSYVYQGECVNALPNLREAGQLAEGDELILDMVDSGFEACSLPTATPDTESPGSGEATEQS